MRFTLPLLVVLLLTACVGAPKYRFDKGEYGFSAPGMESLAEQGDPQAQMDLGYLYEHGFGEPKDLGKAQEYYQKAGDQGLTRADVCLALLLISNKEIPHDYPRAVELFKRADAAGDQYASYYLSWAYRDGIGVPKDQAEADRLRAKAGSAVQDVMIRYANSMRAHVSANQHFPGTALAGHYGGNVTVAFTIDAPYAKGAAIETSSGHADLDDAAIAAVYQTYYPSLPPGIWLPGNFQVEINFVYP